MFSSKTLAERNNDPEPSERIIDGARTSAPMGGNTNWRHAPRPEFQHGKLEANTILLVLRGMLASGSDPETAVKQFLLEIERPANDRDMPINKHAHRVLTLWLAVFA